MDVQVHFFQFCSESLQNHVDTPRMSECFLATLVARILDGGWEKKKKKNKAKL